ncbi:MAG TPA: hypothetical protein VKD22_17735 [Ramlibacter sp.]|nr:hypothetical protein [Ramlibacter sp.]
MEAQYAALKTRCEVEFCRLIAARRRMHALLEELEARYATPPARLYPACEGYVMRAYWPQHRLSVDVDYDTMFLCRDGDPAAAPSAALPQDAVIADVLAVVGVVQKK